MTGAFLRAAGAILLLGLVPAFAESDSNSVQATESRDEAGADSAAESARAARVAEIAAWLSEGQTLPGRPADDRVAWRRLAERPQVARYVRLAEYQMQAPAPVLTPELFAAFRTKGTRTDYEAPFNQRSERLAHFVLAECIEDRGRFLPAIETELAAILSESTWAVPSHWYGHGGEQGAMVVDLAATARAWTLAAADRWLGRRLRPETRAAIRSEIRRRVWEPYLVVARSGQKAPGIWWPFSDNNWNAVCHAGVVCSALALIEDPRERAEFVAAAEAFLPRYLAGFGPDGYCSEGVGYWNYGFGHYVVLADTVRRATGGRVDWLASEAVRRIALYPAKLEIADGVFPAYADSSVNARPSPWLADFLERHLGLGRPEWRVERPPDPPLYHPLGATLFAAGTLLFDQRADAAPAPDLAPKPPPLRDRFDVAQVFTFRPKAGAPALALSLKGGHNAELHNHNDVGSYVLVLDGRALVVDPGAEPYTARTFSARRYESKVLASYGHSVPLVNGRQQSTGRQHAAVVTDTRFGDEEEFVTLDLARAYAEPALVSLGRTVRFRRGAAASVEVEDRVEYSGPAAFGSALITYGEISRVSGERFLIRQDGLALSVRIDTGGLPYDLVDEILPDPLTSGKKARRVGINLRGLVRQARVTLRYEPAAGEAPAPERVVHLPATTRALAPAARLEAEAFDHQQGGRVDMTVRAAADTLALRGFGGTDGHELGWSFETDRAGLYALRLRYARAGGDPARRLVQLDDQPAFRAAFPSTGGWSAERDDWRVAWAGEETASVFKLSPGRHTLRLRAESGAMSLDWIELVPLGETSLPAQP